MCSKWLGSSVLIVNQQVTAFRERSLDAGDWKSSEALPHAGSTPAPGTSNGNWSQSGDYAPDGLAFQVSTRVSIGRFIRETTGRYPLDMNALSLSLRR